MHAESTTNFGTNRLTGNCSIALPLKSRDVARSVTWCGPGQVARYLRDAGATVFGLNLPDGALAGIAAFYAIVNIPKELLPLIFREMQRVRQPDGLLLLAFHSGDEIRALRWKRSSSGTLIRRKLSTRAEELTSSPGKLVL